MGRFYKLTKHCKDHKVPTEDCQMCDWLSERAFDDALSALYEASPHP